MLGVGRMCQQTDLGAADAHLGPVAVPAALDQPPAQGFQHRDGVSHVAAVDDRLERPFRGGAHVFSVEVQLEGPAYQVGQGRLVVDRPVLGSQNQVKVEIDVERSGFTERPLSARGGSTRP